MWVVWISMCLTLFNPMDCSQAPLSLGSSRPEHWSGCHFLLQGIFPTLDLQGSNLGLLHCKWILHCRSHQGSPSYSICLSKHTFVNITTSVLRKLLRLGKRSTETLVTDTLSHPTPLTGILRSFRDPEDYIRPTREHLTGGRLVPLFVCSLLVM